MSDSKQEHDTTDQRPQGDCPRCGRWIPTDDQPGAYPGADSRVDDTTEICSPCGVDEADAQLRSGKKPTKQGWVRP
jgi:hypothetical protein